MRGGLERSKNGNRGVCECSQGGGQETISLVKRNEKN